MPQQTTDSVQLLNFQFEHLELFTWRDDDFKTYNINSEFVRALANAEKGDCYTAVYQGRIIVIGGILPLSGKTGYCFTLFSKYAGISAAKIVKRMFDNMVEDMGLHRVVTYNRADAQRHNDWVEWLGFKEEGICRKFDDEGNDYVQYAKVL